MLISEGMGLGWWKCGNTSVGLFMENDGHYVLHTLFFLDTCYLENRKYMCAQLIIRPSTQPSYLSLPWLTLTVYLYISKHKA